MTHRHRGHTLRRRYGRASGSGFAAYLIRMSVREDRTVTEYPDTREQETALLDDLMSTDGYEGSADVSGSGYSAAEARGYTDVWGDTWRVHVVHAAVA